MRAEVAVITRPACATGRQAATLLGEADTELVVPNLEVAVEVKVSMNALPPA
jgi:hypothetical protein